MVSGFALLGYILATFKPATLWNPGTWWQSIAVWFAAAVVAHDLLLFPLYALADRVLSARAAEPPEAHPKVLARNYIRVPALGAGLTLLIFLPGIIEQGAPDLPGGDRTNPAAVPGQVAAAHRGDVRVSAVGYATRLAAARRRARAAKRTSCPSAVNPAIWQTSPGRIPPTPRQPSTQSSVSAVRAGVQSPT